MRLLPVLLAACCWLSAVSADPLWVRTYNGPYDYYDEVHAVGVDDSGDVIVSGTSYVADGDQEFVTIKYRPNGDTAWLRHFNPGSGLDGATALAVDRSGNVIVTGYIGDASSHYGDWVTIKYSPAGDSLWAVPRDFGDQDRPTVVVTDSAGNSFVTGRAGWLNDLDFVVVKYDPNGSETWVFQYNGGYDDGADAVVLDPQGYTYVTGYTEPGGGHADLMTWKLGPGGESLWVNIWSGPAGGWDRGLYVALDAAGYLVVSGLTEDSANADDFITIKYSPTGDTVWTRCYNGPGNRDDYVAGLALDAVGSVYLTGTSDVDVQGHYNYATIKYSPTGEQRWVIRYVGPRYYDRACGVVVDADANVYVAGSSVNSSNQWDVVTVKYDSTGDEKWLERFNMPSMFDEAYVMALSRQGTVFVGGRTDNDTTGIDYLTLAYGAAGGVEECPMPRTSFLTAAATIARGVLFLPRDMTEIRPGISDRVPRPLLDATGRKVMELVPGPNDVRALAPGVYFVRFRAAQVEAVRKLLLVE